MWLTPTGRLFPNLLQNPQPLSGVDKNDRLPRWVTIDGGRQRVIRRGVRFTLHDELGHMGVSGEAWCAELSDGSFYWLVRDLASGAWLGEPVR